MAKKSGRYFNQRYRAIEGKTAPWVYLRLTLDTYAITPKQNGSITPPAFTSDAATLAGVGVVLTRTLLQGKRRWQQSPFLTNGQQACSEEEEREEKRVK